MDIHRKRDEAITTSPQKTEEGKQELYLYSLRKMAEQNVDSNIIDLTNLHNLKSFFYLGGEMIRKNQEERFAVIVMDIAQFKAVNEFLGRSVGDKLLQYIADCFRRFEETRPNTLAGHVRADIFCMCTSFVQEQELVDIVNDIGERIEHFPIGYKVLPSFGICPAMEKEPAISYLKDGAVTALNTIKGKFYARYAFFDEEMRQKQMLEKQIESDIVEALQNEDFALYIQPKVDMNTGKIVGGEALVRWVHPDKGIIAPGEFIPVLEKNGFIINVDIYVWEQAFCFLGRMLKEKKAVVPLSVNVSRVHAYDKDFCSTLMQLREKYEVPPSYVILELTESAFLEDEEGMYQRIRLLREQGFRVSMDDFGTGYSSMNMLKNQNMDEIKIDRAFIDDMHNPKSRIIVSHTIDMLQELNTNIIVEGVENQEQREFLLKCGCSRAQGFLFYKPMPVSSFERLLQEQVEKENRNGSLG